MALLAVLIMACSQGQQAAKNAVTPSPSSCRLPISIADSGGRLQGAFIDYASGSVTIDPNGANGAYYDRDFSRWVPVNQSAVSSDGTRYAYLDRKVQGTPGRARLHVVDVATGLEEIVNLGGPGDTSAYVVVSFAPEGIWLSYAGYESPSAGLFLLDARTTVLRDLGGQEIFAPVADGYGAFWFTDGGPNPQASAGMGSIIQARIQRLTISDSKTEPWFSEPGSYLRILGTDLAGHLIFTDGKDIRLALSPSETKVIGLPQGEYQLFADRHGVWFGGQTGIYVYSGGNLQKISEQVGAPAGPCA